MELWGDLGKVWELNSHDATGNFAMGLTGVTAALSRGRGQHRRLQAVLHHPKVELEHWPSIDKRFLGQIRRVEDEMEPVRSWLNCKGFASQKEFTNSVCRKRARGR